MNDQTKLWLIAGSCLVTFIPRIFPILALKKAKLPLSFQKWMSYLPVSIFAALICSDIFFWNDQVSFNLLENAKLVPSIITAVVSYKSKNMILSVGAGILSITMMVWLLGV